MSLYPKELIEAAARALFEADGDEATASWDNTSKGHRYVWDCAAIHALDRGYVPAGYHREYGTGDGYTIVKDRIATTKDATDAALQRLYGLTCGVDLSERLPCAQAVHALVTVVDALRDELRGKAPK